MNNPEIKKNIDEYLLIWKEFALQAKINKVDVHSDGHVTGYLEISNSDINNPVILLVPTQFNFSAERTRSQTAKQLSEKFPHTKFNWVELFDYLGYKIQELARSGEPVQEIWAEDDVPSLNYLLHPTIIEGVSNIIYGEKGVNKSTLCYAMGGILNLGWKDNPLELEVDGNGKRVLVLDWETNENIFRYYLSRLRKGTFNNYSFQLYYRPCRLPLIEELDSIEKYINDIQIDILIIDSLAAAAGGESGELKGSQSALQFNSALKKLRKTSLIIAQTSKSPDNNKKTIYGSVIFTYYARNIFELCKNNDDFSDNIHLALFHRECNLGKKHGPLGFGLKFDEQSKSISVSREPIDVEEFSEKVSTQNRILNALQRGTMSSKELMDTLEIPKRNTLDQAISRLSKAHKVIKLEGKWGLPAI